MPRIYSAFYFIDNPEVIQIECATSPRLNYVASTVFYFKVGLNVYAK